MKFFTKEWCFSELEDQLIEQLLEDYKKYINYIYLKLPFTLKVFVKQINVHDGIVKKLTIDQNKRSLILEGVFGDLQVGYYLLKIKYFNVSNLDLENLCSFFKGEKIEILSDEIEMLSPNNFSHKMLFSNKREIEFLFEDLGIEICNTTAGQYTKECCQLEVLGDSNT